MRTHRIRLLLLIALTVGGAGAMVSSSQNLQYSGTPYQAPGSVPMRWYKGNTHTHTINNGGDSTPSEVVTWYRLHGYQFLVLTDHNLLTNVDGLNATHGLPDQFLVVRGEEVTSGVGGKAVHVNGLEVTRVVEAAKAPTVLETLQANIDGIRAASGVPHINHPNFVWGLTFDDLRQARNYKLFEVYNGHPSVNNLGGGGLPGLEEVWDRLLSSGMMVYGMATDDAHVFKDPGNPLVSGPGRGWVVVRAPKLEAGALMASLERGDFYASTGVTLDDVTATARDLTVKVKAEGASKYRIQFIGRDSTVLFESPEPTATYAFKGTETFVRAKVIESNGRYAWVQPVPVARTGTLENGVAWVRRTATRLARLD
jgi:hypothetical protein